VQFSRIPFFEARVRYMTTPRRWDNARERKRESLQQRIHLGPGDVAVVRAAAQPFAPDAFHLADHMSSAQMLVHDLLLMSVVTTVGAAFTFRWLALIVPVLLIAAATAATMPHQAMRAFSIGTGVSLIAMLWLGRKTI
jgi:hypothetical protein